jgi:hypothetical protein
VTVSSSVGRALDGLLSRGVQAAVGQWTIKATSAWNIQLSGAKNNFDGELGLYQRVLGY